MYRSPGVYNKEIDDSLYVVGAASAVTGMVGVTEKGPIGEPVLITNWPQFVNTFGGFLSSSWLAYAAKGFFDNGGAVLYVVRTAHYTDVADASTVAAAASTIDVMDGATTPAVAFTVTAQSAGTWADGYNVVVSLNPDTTLKVVLQDDSGNTLETFASVQDTNAAADDYVETVINGASRYVTVSVTGSSAVAGTYTLSGGDDGIAGITDSDYVGSAAAKTGLYALDDVDSLKLVSVPGVESNVVHAAIGDYAEGRGTVFGIVGTPQGLSPVTVIDYRMGEGTYTHASFNLPYAAMYWPWIRIYDPLTSTTIDCPVEGHVAGMISQSEATTELWYAPAGLNRGTLNGVLGVEYKTTQGERDETYSNAINAIASFPGDGVVVWGQKCLVTKPSALDRVNVRRLLNYIKEALADTSRFLLFEPNDQRTWNRFIRFSEPLLQTIKDGRGLIDFYVLCDETTNTAFYMDNNTMRAKVFIKPTKAVEFLEINYVVTDSGANFEELR